MRRLAPLLACALLLALPGAALAARLNLLDTESQFICVSCHEPLELVSSPQAQQEKAFLAGLIARGQTLPQIKQAMVGAYGEAVLAAPPAQGFNLLIYVLPPLAAAAGLLLLIYKLPRWRRRAQEQAPLASAAPLDPEDSDRLQQELDRFR